MPIHKEARFVVCAQSETGEISQWLWPAFMKAKGEVSTPPLSISSEQTATPLLRTELQLTSGTKLTSPKKGNPSFILVAAFEDVAPAYKFMETVRGNMMQEHTLGSNHLQVLIVRPPEAAAT